MALSYFAAGAGEREAALFMATSTVIGAAKPSNRRASTKVVVFQ